MSSKVVVNKKPYKVIISNKKIHSLQPLFFHVRDITTQAYSTDDRETNENNKEVEKTLKRYTLKILAVQEHYAAKNLELNFHHIYKSGQIAFETSGSLYMIPKHSY